MLSPQIPPSRSRRSRVPLVAAAVATVILVPFIIKDAFGSSDDADEPVIATVAVTTEPPPTTALPPDPEATAAARTVEVDPDWPAKGTSVFGESEAETRARIKARDATPATPELPPPTAVSTTRPVGTDRDPQPAAAPTTAGAAPAKSPPPPRPAPTAAPTTAPRPTTAPTTQSPTTTTVPAAAADG